MKISRSFDPMLKRARSRKTVTISMDRIASELEEDRRFSESGLDFVR